MPRSLLPQQTYSRQILTDSKINSSTALFSRHNDPYNRDKTDDDRSRPNIVKIETHQDYLDFLQQDDRLCIVKFFAKWCKSCRRFGVSFRHLASEEGDHININGDTVHLGDVRFAEVEYSQNFKLCKTLKVKKLPTVHYYKRGEGKISELTCKPSQFQLVVDEMNRLVTESVDVDDVDREDPDSEEQELSTVPSNKNVIDSGDNVTAPSLNEAIENLSQEIMKKIDDNQTASSRDEGKGKKPWFIA